LAKTSIAPSWYVRPEEPAAAAPVLPVSGILWWPLATLIVLVVLFDPLHALTPRIVFLIAAVAALVLGSSLVVAHNQPMRLRLFDALFVLLLFYMSANFFATTVAGSAEADALLRFLRLAAQLCVFYAVVNTCLRRPALRARCLQLVWWSLILSCLFGLLQAFGQQTGAFNLFFEYQRTRTFLEVWQVTGPFAEPSLLGQFLVAGLFLFFARIDSIFRNWPVFALIIVSAGLTQSTGTLFGVVAWALFLVVYNYRELLSLHQLKAKLVIVLLIAVALASFHAFSRLSLIELVSLQLDSSGHQRLTSELAAIGYLIERGWTDGLLFGIGESQAEILRVQLGFWDVGGNALVELMIRYGLAMVLLLLVLFVSLLGGVPGLMLVAIFVLLGQIDGAVAKPFIWLYSALIGLGLLDTRHRVRPAAADPAARGRVLAPPSGAL